MGRQKWHFEDTKPGMLKTIMARFAHEKIKIPLEVINGVVDKVAGCFGGGKKKEEGASATGGLPRLR